VRPLTWAYKFTREIARRMPHFRGELHMVHPAFAPGGPASTIDPSHSIRRVSYILRTTSEHLMHSHTPTVRGNNFSPHTSLKSLMDCVCISSARAR
jgi:hypothetical protein